MILPFIEIHDITKIFRIPVRNRSSLREYFAHPFMQDEYHAFTALRHIDLSVRKGEWVGIIGPNGSGKSTLAKIVAGIYLPDGGEVQVRGTLVPLLGLGTGFHPELSCRRNIFINGVLLGIPRARLRQRLSDIIRFAGIEAFLDWKLGHLSSGMQARLAFSVTVEAEGGGYLFDEALAAGDYEFQQKARKAFERLRMKRRSALLISHDLEAIEHFCDRVVLLQGGMVQSVGPPRDVIHSYIHSSHKSS